jgi:CO/xanthine dehydrogenase FAD-binding subunit
MTVTVRTLPTLAQAAGALAMERGARFLAGGTLVMRAINEGETRIATIIRTTDRAFTEVRIAGGRIEIGAGVTMARVLAHRDLAILHPAARIVGGPAVRSMATIGGNLFAPPPYGDFATALLVLDASVLVVEGNGLRDMPLEQMLAIRDRAPLVAAVVLTRTGPADAFRFRKVARVKPKGISVLSIAAWLPASGGRIAGARVAYGAMAATPMRARSVERALEGRTLDEAGVADAVRVAADGTNPATDAIASAWYRREVLPVHLRRALLEQPR